DPYIRPVLAGPLSISGWVLDRAGIHAVTDYIDDEKVADARYGEPSPEIQKMYTSAPNSGQARYSAAGIDTSAFKNGPHVLGIRALTPCSQWVDVSSALVDFFNDKVYDFWSRLPEVRTHGHAAVKDTMLSIGQEARRVLLHCSDSEVIFEKVPV